VHDAALTESTADAVYEDLKLLERRIASSQIPRWPSSVRRVRVVAIIRA